MVTVTLTISDEVKGELKRFSWINWSEVARQKYILQEELAKEWKKAGDALSSSKLTEEEAFKLADEFKERLAKRYLKLSKEMK